MNSSIVITSKLAKDHYQDIVGKHGDLLIGMAIHAQKVQALNQQKQVAQQNADAMRMDMEKQKMVADTEAAKDANAMALKQEELSIKRAALSAV